MPPPPSPTLKPANRSAGCRDGWPRTLPCPVTTSGCLTKNGPFSTSSRATGTGPVRNSPTTPRWSSCAGRPLRRCGQHPNRTRTTGYVSLLPSRRPSVSPLQQAKQALGGRLREIQAAAGLTQRDLAQLTGWHSSKASRIEYGKQVPSEDDIKKWCLHCSAPDEIADLMATVRALDEMWVEWRRSLGTGIRHRQREQIVFEGSSRLLRWYESLLVPGILHTPDYARGVLSRIIDFYGVVDDLEQAVEARMERQQILYRGDHRLHLLLAEQ